MSKDKMLQFSKQYSAIILLLSFIILNSFITPNFFQVSNLNNIITQICPIILCGMGMTMVISTGGIDIAVGSVMALAGVLTAKLMTDILLNVTDSSLFVFTGVRKYRFHLFCTFI